jgi:hypothetical protein
MIPFFREHIPLCSDAALVESIEIRKQIATVPLANFLGVFIGNINANDLFIKNAFPGCNFI